MKDLIEKLREEIYNDLEKEESFEGLVEEAKTILGDSTYAGLLMLREKLKYKYSIPHSACQTAVKRMLVEEYKKRKLRYDD